MEVSVQIHDSVALSPGKFLGGHLLGSCVDSGAGLDAVAKSKKFCLLQVEVF